MTKVQGNPSMSHVDRNDLTDVNQIAGLNKMINTSTPDASIGTGAKDITVAQLSTGILEEDATAQVAWTLPTPALVVAAIPNAAIGDCIDFSVINSGSVGTEEEITITMPANAGSIGNMVVPCHSVTHDADRSGSGLFRIRLTAVTGTEKYLCYRLA